ncbi:hypothetical protein GCM10010837_30020 [Aminobacter niigataensis]
MHQIDITSAGEGIRCQPGNEIFDSTQLAAGIRAHDRRDLSAEMSVAAALICQRDMVKCCDARIEIELGAICYLAIMIGKSDNLESIRSKYFGYEIFIENAYTS